MSKKDTDEYLTPASIIRPIGLTYDLDPCAPVPGSYAPEAYVVDATVRYWYLMDGLRQQWEGRVFMNPPFGKRNSIVAWLKKFLEHGDGIGIATAKTSSGWFQDYMIEMDALLFPRGKTRFVKLDGTLAGNPFHGIVLFARGDLCRLALQESGLGIFVDCEDEPKAIRRQINHRKIGFNQ